LATHKVPLTFPNLHPTCDTALTSAATGPGLEFQHTFGGAMQHCQEKDAEIVSTSAISERAT